MDNYNIKIAIPIYNGKVMDHIGLCPLYSIFSITCGEITKEAVLTIPDETMTGSNIALLLAQNDVKILLAGKIELEEIELLIYHGIKVYYNYEGDTKKVLETFLNKEFLDIEWKENGFSKISTN